MSRNGMSRDGIGRDGADRDERLLTRLVALDAAAFTLGSMAHLGLRLSVGPLHFADPRLLAPMLVDATCVVGFVVALAGLAGRRSWRLTAALGAHLIGTTGIAFGILAMVTGAAPRTGTTDILHPLLLVPLGFGFAAIGRLRARGEADEREKVTETVRRLTPAEPRRAGRAPDAAA